MVACPVESVFLRASDVPFLMIHCPVVILFRTDWAEFAALGYSYSILSTDGHTADFLGHHYFFERVVLSPGVG
jgi:hypothetical protein